MYTDIGLRNHNAVMRNGTRLVENWNEKDKMRDYRDDALKALAQKYGGLLQELDTLFKAANLLIND